MPALVLISLATSLVLALIFVPLVRSLAIRFGMVDAPDAERKLQEKPVALAGGVAVFSALLLTFFGVLVAGGALPADTLARIFGPGIDLTLENRWIVLFGAAAGIVGLGLLDDVIALRGRQKLLIQFVIMLVVVGSGTTINSLGLLGYSFDLGVMSLPVSVLWLLIATNALNLIDGADGMASTVGAIVATGLAFLSFASDNMLAGVAATALAGSLVGFLAYNRPPATIYLGDAGSMMIGLFLGVLAVWSGAKQSTALSAAPVAILALPLFDSSAAIVRRWLTGRSIYATDRGHLHHLLLAKYGNVGMLAVVAVTCFTMTALAVASRYLAMPVLSVLGVAVGLGALILTRSFGHGEARLLAGRTRHFVRSFTVRPSECDSERQQRCVNVQGDGCWEDVWEPLLRLAQEHEVAKIKLNINLPWLHESFHGAWHSVRVPEKAFQMDFTIPLFARQPGADAPVSVGMLKLICPANDGSARIKAGALIEKLDDLEPQIESVIAKLVDAASANKGTSRSARNTTRTEPDSECEVNNSSSKIEAVR